MAIPIGTGTAPAPEGTGQRVPTIKFHSVTEHDIDLLLVQLLACSFDFQHWFYSRITGDAATPELLIVRHSAVGAQGESDLEAVYLSPDGGKCAVLVENKIEAQLQPRQLDRYIERGLGMVEEHSCSTFVCVLMAPAKYLGTKALPHEFRFLSYENVLEWLRSQVSKDRFAAYGMNLLEFALDKPSGNSGNETVTAFWFAYWELAKTLAPELMMERPQIKPGASSFIYFHPNLPSDIHLIRIIREG